MKVISQLLSLVLTVLFIENAFSYSIVVAPSAPPQCFIVTTTADTPCTGSFEVISGDPDSLVVSVIGPPPDSTIHFESSFKDGVDADRDLSEGSFSFDAPVDGDYVMCISNSAAITDTTDRVVAFNFRSLKREDGELNYEYVGLDTELVELLEGLNMLKDHQSYMSQREDVHKNTLEGIKIKVMCWTVLEAVILIAMAFWQISYISAFFETKRRL